MINLFPGLFRLLVLIAVLGGCAGTPSLQSSWQAEDVSVDGGTQEWRGQYTTIADDQLDVAVSNDADYLYLSLISASKELHHQILRQGLIVWFNSGSKQNKNFGIHYPLGIMGYGGESGDLAGLEQLPEMDRQQRLELLTERFQVCLTQLEILDQPDQAGLRLAVEDAPGIELVVDNSSTRLAYELKIPLRKSPAHPYAVGEATADKVTLGFQTIELDREALREQMSAMAARGGSGASGYGRRPGGMPGGMPSGMGRGMPAPPDPIDTWLKVKLEISK